MAADRFEQPVEVGQAVRLDARDVQLRPGHLDAQPDAVAREAFGGHRLPRLAVVGDRHGLQLAGDRARLPVPDVVQVPELERELGAGACVEPEVDVPRGAVRRGALVVVEQVDPDDAVGDVVPERRGVLEARVDELEGWRRGR